MRHSETIVLERLNNYCLQVIQEKTDQCFALDAFRDSWKIGTSLDFSIITDVQSCQAESVSISRFTRDLQEPLKRRLTANEYHHVRTVENVSYRIYILLVAPSGTL